MTTHPHHVPVGTIAVAAFAGALIGLQSRANGGLSIALGNSREAALISFGTGFVVLMVLAAISAPLRDGLRAIRAAVQDGRLPRWQTLAGMMGAFFVIVQAFAVPKTGVAIFSVATIAGQSAMSLAVDRLGLRAGVRHHITARRIVTAAVTVAAVAISVADRLQGAVGWITVLAVLCGAIVAVQRALNAHITDYSSHSYATTWLNFCTGVVFLLVANFTLGAEPLQRPPSGLGSWWMYTGGTIGVVYIALSSVLVQRLGVLVFTAVTVGGQLLGSLLIDLAFPTRGVVLGPNVYAGVVLSCIAILMSVRVPKRNKASA